MENNCDKCFKKLKDNEEVFETDNGDYICLDCLERANEQAELLYEDKMRGID